MLKCITFFEVTTYGQNLSGEKSMQSSDRVGDPLSLPTKSGRLSCRLMQHASVAEEISSILFYYNDKSGLVNQLADRLACRGTCEHISVGSCR